ncbi:MAG: hypothetical protein NTY04_03325 [Candidatus Staskawiczbacteria bacterium]|nr:hypothetical protein [Candidatus Staskawiczbacteria bacterium]
MDYKKDNLIRSFLRFITGPFIWFPLPFLIMLDLICELYQFICFPIYKIKWLKRSEYILILDRNKLKYLNPMEKIGCMYCGYTNGALRYMKEVAGLTEKYWCGIMHENKPGFKTREDQVRQNFSKFGDEKDFHNKYGKN